jgi:hypothetical protein
MNAKESIMKKIPSVWCLFRGNEENHKETQSGKLVSRPRL